MEKERVEGGSKKREVYTYFVATGRNGDRSVLEASSSSIRCEKGRTELQLYRKSFVSR